MKNFNEHPSGVLNICVHNLHVNLHQPVHAFAVYVVLASTVPEVGQLILSILSTKTEAAILEKKRKFLKKTGDYTSPPSQPQSTSPWPGYPQYPANPPALLPPTSDVWPAKFTPMQLRRAVQQHSALGKPSVWSAVRYILMPFFHKRYTIIFTIRAFWLLAIQGLATNAVHTVLSPC